MFRRRFGRLLFWYISEVSSHQRDVTVEIDIPRGAISSLKTFWRGLVVTVWPERPVKSKPGVCWLMLSGDRDPLERVSRD